MTTLRSKIEEATFWDGLICLSCTTTFEGDEGLRLDLPCPECDQLGLFKAVDLSRFLERVEAEDEE